MASELHDVLAQFQLEREIVDIKSFGTGHINSTFLARIRQTNGGVRKYVLQQINRQVFTKPEKVMGNIKHITAHLKQKIIQAGGDPNRETLAFLQTRNGRSFHKTDDGEYWRLSLFIEDAETYQHAPSLNHYYEAAHAYGRFQTMLADFPTDQLHETIPDFHHTGKRLAAFETAVSQDKAHRAQHTTTEICFIRQHADMAAMLTNLQESGEIPLRVTHNDTKLDNILFDSQTGKGICVIDLDTVMPGIALFDFADTVRSSANLAAEDEPDTTQITFDLEIYRQLVHGFLDAARPHLSAAEVNHLAFAARLITYEQAMRFLTDYLNGDVYYKTSYLEHNLVRCRTQIRLLQLMKANQSQMENIVKAYR